MRMLQQGDVLIEKVGKIPSRTKLKANTIVALGEATGHCHEVIGDGVEVYDCDGVLYVSAPNGGTIRHQEHKPIDLAPGNYQIGIVREFDHYAEEARQVRD